VTPEQAIAATVGTGTCRLKKGETAWFADYNGYVTEWTCDECGGFTFYDAEMRPRSCADCGRKVVEWAR
jgi:ABC-type ATPase with predicted acetyltransferase domain